MKYAAHFITLIVFSPLAATTPAFLHKVTLDNLDHFYQYYNHRLYAERLLSRTFVHCMDLLEYAAVQENPEHYIETVISLFHQRVKECSWINPWAFTQLLDHMTTSLNPLSQELSLEEEAKTISAYLEEKILTDQHILHTNPKVFAENIALELAQNNREKQARFGTKMLVARFIETCFDRLIWDTDDKEYTWKIFILLGSQTETLYQRSIIPDATTAHHLLWSLTYSFCRFISLAGALLPAPLYEKMLKDIEEDKVPWLVHPEIDSHAISKKRILSRALNTGLVRAYAYEKHNIIA